MTENIPVLVAVATAVGSAIGFVVSNIIQIFTTRAERKHKRIELHVSYLQDQLIRIDERLDKIINANAVSVGLAIGEEEYNLYEPEAFNCTVFNFAMTQNSHELTYLGDISKTYGLDEKFNNEIYELVTKLNVLNTSAVFEAKAEHLAEALSMLMEIQVKYRTLLHVLVIKLLD